MKCIAETPGVVASEAGTPTILTASGIYYDLVYPTPEMIAVKDIAAALSKICRFTGQTSRFYSVAQHSVIVSELVPLEWSLAALLHDAPEAYLGDVSKPLKRILPDYIILETRAMIAIVDAFKLVNFWDHRVQAAIKHADYSLLIRERDLFMPKGKGHDWGGEFTSLDHLMIEPLLPEEAEAEFMQKFLSLTTLKS